MRIAFIIPSIALAATLLLAACDKPKDQQSRAVTKTTTRPADVDAAPPTTLPTSRPVTSTLAIKGIATSFPPARLVLQQKEPKLTLLLFSDDPDDAIKATYAGNRYYLEIELDIDDVAQLSAIDWHYKAASATRADSPHGIFLDGDKQHLQPYDVHVRFTSTPSHHVTMSIDGQFLLFRTRDENAAPAQNVLVQGVLVTELEGLDGKNPRPNDRRRR